MVNAEILSTGNNKTMKYIKTVKAQSLMGHTLIPHHVSGNIEEEVGRMESERRSVTKHYSLDMTGLRIHIPCGYLQEIKLVKIPACDGKGCKNIIYIYS